MAKYIQYRHASLALRLTHLTRLLKVAGRNQGLEGLCRALGMRLAKGLREVEAEPA